jgi:hypothetical protein
MVYDFDDAVMYGRKGESATRRNRFAAIVRASKAVLCGNSFLMEEASSTGIPASTTCPPPWTSTNTP